MICSCVVVVAALVCVSDPVSVVLPLNVLLPAIDSVSVLWTKPAPSIVIFTPAVSVTPKPPLKPALLKSAVLSVPTSVPFLSYVVAGPVAPVAPWIPVAPVAPIAPVAPVLPSAPCAPVAPVLPWTP